MTDQLHDLIADIFDLEPADISEELTPEDVELWDSLNHLKLITAVEQSYGIQFTMAEVQAIDSVLVMGVLASTW
jgi:acyl carrier protein